MPESEWLSRSSARQARCQPYLNSLTIAPCRTCLSRCQPLGWYRLTLIRPERRAARAPRSVEATSTKSATKSSTAAPTRTKSTCRVAGAAKAVVAAETAAETAAKAAAPTTATPARLARIDAGFHGLPRGNHTTQLRLDDLPLFVTRPKLRLDGWQAASRRRRTSKYCATGTARTARSARSARTRPVGSLGGSHRNAQH